MTYFFILGNNPLLSIGEIYAVLRAKYQAKDSQFCHFSEEALLFEADSEIDVNLLQKRLNENKASGFVISSTKSLTEKVCVLY